MSSICNTTKIIGTYMLLLLLFSCPGHDDDCFDLGSTTRVDDLILLTPEQTTFTQGDIITLKIDIPAINMYYGNEVNLYITTGDTNALLVLGFNELFLDNTLNFTKGSQSSETNWFNMPYNSETGNYELEIQVQLNKTGDYYLQTLDFIEFIGENCNRYRLDTNVLWAGDAIVEFTVNE